MRLWHDIRLLNLAANAMFGATLLAVIAAGAWWVAQRPAFTLHALVIEPAAGSELKHVSSTSLKSAGRRDVRGNFFTVDLERVRAAFESVPWVRRATVRRIWPDRLAVVIEEHRPFAVWGEAQLMNTFGELYTANLAEAEEAGPLPAFAGPLGSEQQVLRRYQELIGWLQPIGRRPEALSLSPRWAWSVRLDDGTSLMLGRDQGVPIEERVQRWVRVFPQVQARLDRKAEVIDLRYPNGFAIRSVALLSDGDTARPRPKGRR